MRLALAAVVSAALSLLPACGKADTEVPATLVGTIAAIEEKDGEIVSFTLAGDEVTLEVFIDPQVEYGFDLAHLKEHEASEEPVRCTLAERDGRAYALTILDV
jgi:hypothetical protein